MNSKKLAVLKKSVIGQSLLVNVGMGGEAYKKRNKWNIIISLYVPLTKSITYPFHCHLNPSERPGTDLLRRDPVLFFRRNVTGTRRSPCPRLVAAILGKNLFRDVTSKRERLLLRVSLVCVGILLGHSGCSIVSNPPPAQPAFNQRMEATK